MPSDIYVAGPLSEGPFDPRAQLYAQLSAAAEEAGLSVALPVRDDQIDLLPPNEFTRAVIERIREARAVITVLAPGDQSVPVEAAMASGFEKPQLVVVDGGDVPRLIAGLPLIFDVVAADDPQTALAALRDFLSGGASTHP
jgi:hypothetical protein